MSDLNIPSKEQKERELSFEERMAVALETIAKSQASGDSLDAVCIAMIDGTRAGYARAMKAWFAAQGASSKSAAELTALVDRWYEITRVPWDGGTEFYQPNVTAISTGTKYGDNAGMECTPSTDTVANRDDYAGHPVFAVTDCNWQINPETTEVEITAIDGITPNFERYNPAKYVGVLQMNGYTYQSDGGNTYKIGYTTQFKPYATIDAPFGVRPGNNTFRQWTIHSKYLSNLTADNKMTACAGVAPRTRVMSHDTIHTYAANNGAGYSGGSVTDWAFLQYMAYTKYASLTLDGILQGCVNHNYSRAAVVAESNTKRVIIASGNSANFPVGSKVLVGTKGTANDVSDRYSTATYSISGADGCKVTAVKDITVDGSNYTAIYVDCEAFDTVVDTAAPENTTYVRSWHWDTGTTDSVLGNDGSPVSCTSGKYPAKLQGIEYMNGAYEVYADAILNLTQDATDTAKYYYEPYIVRSVANQATSITANYEATGMKLLQPGATAWQYQVKQKFSKGMFYCSDYTGGTSSTYHRDGIYLQAATTGTRAVLSFCALYYGVARGGLSAVDCSIALSYAPWRISARLSPNGNRGEFETA